MIKRTIQGNRIEVNPRNHGIGKENGSRIWPQQKPCKKSVEGNFNTNYDKNRKYSFGSEHSCQRTIQYHDKTIIDNQKRYFVVVENSREEQVNYHHSDEEK